MCGRVSIGRIFCIVCLTSFACASPRLVEESLFLLIDQVGESEEEE